MAVKVVDASMLGALIFQEPEGAKVAARLKNAELIEPPLLAYELASIARKKIIKYPSQRELIIKALETGLTMDIRWVDVDQALVVSLALEKNLTVYDAAYLYLAQLYGATLLTFDARLKSAAS